MIILLSVYGCGRNPVVTRISAIDEKREHRKQAYKTLELTFYYIDNIMPFYLALSYKSTSLIIFANVDKEGWTYAEDSNIKWRYIKTDGTYAFSSLISKTDIIKMEFKIQENTSKYDYFLNIKITNPFVNETRTISGSSERKTSQNIVVSVTVENIILNDSFKIIAGGLKAIVDKYVFTATYKGNNYMEEGIITYNGIQIGTIKIPNYYTDEEGTHANENEIYHP